MSERDILLDVSRLIWRLWRGRLPTGVDRVCLAYLEHFKSRSRAVVQRRGRYFILNGRDSDRLFELLARGPNGFRRAFVQFAFRAFLSARRTPERKGFIYLNVGHTGLDDPSYGPWIAQSGLRAAFFIHDLIPLLYPEYCRPGEQAKHERLMMNVLRSAAGLIGNSKATVRDVETFAAAHGQAMPPTVAAWIAGPPVPPNVAPKRFDRPYFVAVGTIEGRKNHSLLLHVWRRMAADGASEVPLLVIIGQRGWEAESAFAMLDRVDAIKSHVLEFGECPDEELAAIIAGARALLMPSFAEGFGLPVVEALELGTPVIASDLPVFREFAGDIPTYVDCLDGRGWERAIRDFTGDCPERQRQLNRIVGYRGPDWPAHFSVVDAWIETLPQ
jgi:glycosyltransferase involved in cell wall biosynthesis